MRNISKKLPLFENYQNYQNMEKLFECIITTTENEETTKKSVDFKLGGITSKIIIGLLIVDIIINSIVFICEN